MPPTFQKPMHAAGQADISSCQTTIQFPATMVQSSQSRKSSKRSCHLRRKQKSELYTSTAEKPSRLNTYLNTWGINNHPHHANRQHYSTWSAKQQCYEKMKEIDMKFHWLRCRINHRPFRHYWAAGKSNNGDYVTKHHAPIHHQATRPTFLTPIIILQKTTKQNQQYTSCSKGVLDIQYPTIIQG